MICIRSCDPARTPIYRSYSALCNCSSRLRFIRWSRDVTGGPAADGRSSNYPEALLPSKVARAAQSAASRSGSVSCSAASWRILAEGMISGLGGRKIASWPDACQPWRALPGCLEPGLRRVPSAAGVRPSRRGRLVLRGLVADPGGRLGEALIWGSIPLLVLGVASGGWFGGTQGLDFLVGVTAA